MSTIDRVRFYDGEFLRAFDFSDEQTYHLEMRRRVNRYLHLYGIVQGLNLVGSTNSGITQVSIMSGLAIDAFGREIYVFAPYTFGDSDITANRISLAGTYDVWLRYQKTASTPPSAGYGVCNQTNQYTRWVESFSVVLLANPSNPFAELGFAADDTDDPSLDQVGVLLGTVNVDPTSPTGTFYGPLFDPNRCKLLGVIAQNIQAPPTWDASQGNPPFSFLNKNPAGVLNTPISPPASLEITPNVFADQNLIVGQDFPLTAPSGGATTITITPGPTVTDPGAGSVKIAGDLFVQGNIYNLITSSSPSPQLPSPFPPPPGTNLWLAINTYVPQLVQQFLPEIVLGSAQVTVHADSTASVSGGYATNTVTTTVKTTRLKQVTSAIVLASFSQIQTTDRSPDFDALFAGGSSLQLSLTTPPTASFVGQTGTVSVPWLAGPASGTAPGIKSAIDVFTVSCVVICSP